MFDVNWETRSHADIHAQLQGRAGGFTDAGGAWNALATRLRSVAGSVERATSGIAATRTGAAATAAGAAVSPMGPWADQARTFSDAVGAVSYEQNRALEATRGAVGPPVPRPPVRPPTWAGISGLAAHDVDVAERSSLDAERRARAAMGRYQEFSSLRSSALPQFTSPGQGAPQVQVVAGPGVAGPTGGVPGGGVPGGSGSGGSGSSAGAGGGAAASGGAASGGAAGGSPDAGAAGGGAGGGAGGSGNGVVPGPTTVPGASVPGASVPGATAPGATAPGAAASAGPSPAAASPGAASPAVVGSAAVGPTSSGTAGGLRPGGLPAADGSARTPGPGRSGAPVGVSDPLDASGTSPSGAGGGAFGPTGTSRSELPPGSGARPAPEPGARQNGSVLGPALGARSGSGSGTGVPFAPVGGVGSAGEPARRLARAAYLVEDDPDALVGDLPRVAPPVIGE